jgi:hypothetical protein
MSRIRCCDKKQVCRWHPGTMGGLGMRLGTARRHRCEGGPSLIRMQPELP